MKKVSLDLHDFSIHNNHLDQLLEIKSHIPNFKVSMFTIPYDYPLETHPVMRINRQAQLDRIKENLSWIQLIPHGVMHIDNEFANCDKHTMRMVIDGIGDIFDKDNLPYEKGFCAPFWLWNEDVVSVLDDNGWWGAVDRNQSNMVCPKRFYKYSHSLEEPFWTTTDDILKLHGHMDKPSKNNLDDCFMNILKLDDNVEWHFVTDFIETL